MYYQRPNIFIVLFILLGTKFYIFIFQGRIYQQSEKTKKLKKKYYDKYALMLAIHVDNHLSDKFVPMCHVGYFINGDRQKLTT